MAGEHADVEARWFGVERVEVSGVVVPCGQRRRPVVDAEERQVVPRRAKRRGAQSAVADHIGRHTLADLEIHLRRDEDREVVVAVHVDEPGRERKPAGVDAGARPLRGEIAECRDTTFVNCDVAHTRRAARSVVHGRAPDHQVHRPRLTVAPVRFPEAVIAALA